MSLYDLLNIFCRYIGLSGRDFFLIAEDTVVGTAAMGDEDGDYRVFFQF